MFLKLTPTSDATSKRYMLVGAQSPTYENIIQTIRSRLTDNGKMLYFPLYFWRP